MKIVIGTDFSAHAVPAGEVALALARKLGDSLVLAHAFEPFRGQYPEGLTPEIVSAMRKRAQAELGAGAAELRAQGVAVDERLADGPAPDTLVTLGREVDARLLVVGTHGRSAASRLLFGSVAERSVLLSDRPVLVVRARAENDEDGWTSGRRNLRLVVGVDVSSASRAAIAWVRGLRATLPCDVTFLHAYNPADELARLGLVGTGGLVGTHPTVTEAIERELAPLIDDLPGEGRTTLRVDPSWGSTGERLASDARRLGADLLVIGTHQRHALRRLMLGSTVHQTIRAAELPVLCVPSLLAEEEPLPEVRSVLLATDLSDLSKRAIPHAYGLVRPSHGMVHICYVHERFATTVPVYSYGPDPKSGLSADREREIRSALEAMAPREAQAAGITTNVSVVQASHVGEALCQMALRLGVDAICLASHSRSPVGKALIGSVAQEVLAHADRPVFIIRVRPE